VEDSFLTKVQRQFNKERITFATGGVGTTGHPNAKNEPRPITSHITQKLFQNES